jgi:D-alanyl-D-alanine carboxypeptidase
MFGVGAGASRGLRWGILSLAVAVAVVGVTSDPAEAARRRKKAGKTYHKAAAYNPPTASIVVDANTGAVLQSNNPDSKRHPASLTKIMTLYLLFERLEAGRVKLDTEMPVSEHAASQAPSKLGLRPGQTLAVEDAIKALVTKSANDASVVIAEYLAGDEDEFARMMTRKAHALGMSRTVYRNANGLPDDEQVTTARDQALLGRAIQERFPRYYRYFQTPVFVYRGNAMRNHNKLLGRVEGVDGIKTGYIRASGFNLVTSMRRGNRHIVAVVLGGRSGAARDAQMRQLVGEYIQVASTSRTAPAIAEAESARQPQRVATVAPARSEPAPARAEIRAEPARSEAVPPAALAPTRSAVSTAPLAKPGSLEPLKPVAVKTIAVKAGVIQSNGLAGVNVPMAQAAPAELQAAPPAEFPPRPAAARPGILGVLPADAATPGAVRTAPTELAYAAARNEQIAGADEASVVHSAAPEPFRTAAAEPIRATPARSSAIRRGWIIQVGAFPDEHEARERLNSAQVRAKTLLGHADPFTETVSKGDKVLYRARFAGLDKDEAEAACRFLKRNDIACMTVKN